MLELLNNDITDVFNDTIDNNTPSPIALAANFDAQKYKFRTMAMKLLESADVLDDQIDSFSQILQQSHNDINLGNPCLSSQSDIICCGRIVPDSPLYDTLLTMNLNSTSLYLETSRLGGIGQRIPLDLSQLSHYALFPGQIVGLKGRNPTGRTFMVQELIPLPRLGSAITEKSELLQFLQLSKQGIKTVIAAGPFSNLNIVDYTKLDQFVTAINTTIKPHVVVLLGPFLDLTNSAVANGEITIPKSSPSSLDQVFKTIISPILNKISSSIHVIMIPSVKDAAISHSSYPQDSFDRKKLGLAKHIKMFPNPSSFCINEMIVSCSNLDVYKDLKEVTKGLDNDNRFDRITNHVLEQRRYYPLFPGSISKSRPKESNDGLMAQEISETNIGGATLEVPYMGLSELQQSLPDVMIIPSGMNRFAKSINNVLAINPGLFIHPNRDSGKSEGTYVVMNTEAPTEDNIDLAENDMYFHSVWKRTKVEICRS